MEFLSRKTEELSRTFFRKLLISCLEIQASLIRCKRRKRLTEGKECGLRNCWNWCGEKCEPKGEGLGSASEVRKS